MKYFTVEELTYSSTAYYRGIDNNPSYEIENNIRFLINNVLDKIREAWGAPIIVSSGYRCEELNRAVGGSSTSSHMTGLAADLQCKNPNKFDIARLFNIVVELDKQKIISVDQVIIEHNSRGSWWVHVGTKIEHRRNRHQYFSMTQ